MAALQSTYEQMTQQNASDFQQSRGDLQQASDSPQQNVSGSDVAGSLPQDQLNDKDLRVGDSATTIRNTTQATPMTYESTYSAIWLWFGVLIVALAVLTWLAMHRRIKSAKVTEVDRLALAVTAMPASPDKTIKKKKTKTASKATKTKRAHKRTK